MPAIPPVLLAQALSAASRPVLSLSKSPDIIDYGSYVEIVLDPQLQDEIAAFIIRQLEREPGKIRVAGLGGVVARVVGRKYWGWLAGALGGAFTFGRFSGGRKK